MKKRSVEEREAERLLWRHLRSGRLHGYRFYRRHRFGSYIADFYCPDKGLIVEIEGGQYAAQASSRLHLNDVRSRHLDVVRFWHNDVLANLEGVLDAIWNRLAARQDSRTMRCF